MDDAARDQLLRLRAVGRHVGRRRVRLERIHAFPFFDDEERLGSPFRLEAERVLGIDGRPVLDAASFLVDVRDVRPEMLQDLGTLARLGGNDRDDVDQGFFSRMMSSGGLPSSQKTIAFCSKSWPSASAFARYIPMTRKLGSAQLPRGSRPSPQKCG